MDARKPRCSGLWYLGHSKMQATKNARFFMTGLKIHKNAIKRTSETNLCSHAETELWKVNLEGAE